MEMPEPPYPNKWAGQLPLCAMQSWIFSDIFLENVCYTNSPTGPISPPWHGSEWGIWRMWISSPGWNLNPSFLLLRRISNWDRRLLLPPRSQKHILKDKFEHLATCFEYVRMISISIVSSWNFQRSEKEVKHIHRKGHPPRLDREEERGNGNIMPSSSRVTLCRCSLLGFR